VELGRRSRCGRFWGGSNHSICFCGRNTAQRNMATTESTCFDCGFQGHCHQHHVIPRSKGGKNTVPLCEPCHGKVHDHSFLNHTSLIKAGLRRARANGVVCGRPKGTTRPPREVLLNHKDVIRCIEGGMSVRQTAKATGKSPSTVQRVRTVSGLGVGFVLESPILQALQPRESPKTRAETQFTMDGQHFPAFEELFQA
jgi:hypothetical protein